MNIVYLDFRPFSRFVRNGFRQRAGRILYHFIRSDRVNCLAYVWWNNEPFSGIRNEIPDETQYREVLLHEARRIPIPFARRFGLNSSWSDRPRIRKTVSVCRELTDESFWVWATDPRLAVPGRELANRLNGKLCVDLIDNFAVLDDIQGRQSETYMKGYEDTVRLADKIVANNQEMQKFLTIPDKIFKFVANGVDWQVFHDGRNLPEPPEMTSIPRPHVGYVGNLSSLNDVNSLNAVAEEIPNCEIIVVGNTNSTIETLHKRIHVLGMKPYNEVPAYISSFDICLSIYRQHPATQFIDSQKIKEYLAAGKLIIALYSPKSCINSTHISIARDVDEFVHMVREAISEQMDADLGERISLSVANQDWRYRIEEIFSFLGNEVEK